MLVSMKIKYNYSGADLGIEPGRSFTYGKAYDVLQLVTAGDPEKIRAIVIDDDGYLVHTIEPIDTHTQLYGIWTVSEVKAPGININDKKIK